MITYQKNSYNNIIKSVQSLKKLVIFFLSQIMVVIKIFFSDSFINKLFLVVFQMIKLLCVYENFFKKINFYNFLDSVSILKNLCRAFFFFFNDHSTYIGHHYLSYQSPPSTLNNCPSPMMQL